MDHQDINRRLSRIQNYIVKEVLAASVYAVSKARNRRVVRNEGHQSGQTVRQIIQSIHYRGIHQKSLKVVREYCVP